MFGSGVVAAWVYNTLRTRPAITAAIGTPPRIKPYSVLPEPGTPQTVSLPACLHYAESTSYSGPFSAGMEPTEETVNYVVRFICQDVVDNSIRPAAKDALAALSLQFAEGVVTQDGEQFSVTLLPTGEWPITTVVANGVMYRQLGFYLQAQVFRLS